LAFDHAIEVLDSGLLALIEDLGRPGLAEFGVGTSGAADTASLRRANRLVENPEAAAGIELTFGRAAFRFPRGGVVAVCGAPAPVTVAGRHGPLDTPLSVRPGEEVHIGRPVLGLRTYLAVRGGIALPHVLGSQSRDTLAGIGPEPLRPGDVLPVGDLTIDSGSCDLPGEPYGLGLPARLTLRVYPGPRHDWFASDALATLFHNPYTMTPRSDRIGIRLSGPPLRHRRRMELPPEGAVTGAIEVPIDGQPIIFLADHPVTGGYPVIGVIASDDVPLAAQCRPGQTMRFIPAG
jgi:biotin-dependent carboxylase-like uncharacterized protein